MQLKHLYLLSLILIFLTGNKIQAQNYYSKIDSLKQLLKNEKVDTNKIQIYKKLAINYEMSDFDSAMIFYDKAIAITEKNRLPIKTANVLVNKAFSYKYAKNSKQSIVFLRQAIDILEKTNVQKDLLNAYYNLGYFYGSFEDFQEAIKSYEKAVEIGFALQDSAYLSRIYNNLGLTYQYVGVYDKAIQYQLKALTLKQRLNDPTIYVTYVNIGVCYNKQKMKTEAIYNFEQAISLLKNDTTQTEYRNDIGVCYNGIGEAYQDENMYDSALIYYKKAYEHAIKIENYNMMADYHLRIGSIFMSQNNFEEAESAFEKSAEIFPANGSLKLKATILDHRAELSWTLYSLRKDKHELERCIDFASELFELSQKLGMLQYQTNSAKYLYKSLSEKGNTTDAYTYALHYIEYKDSLLNKEKQKITNELLIKYETEKKDEQLAYSKEKQKLHQANEKRNMWLAIIAFFMVAVLLFLVFKQVVNKRRIKSQNIKLKKLNEFKQDMVSMMVHDLKVPLSSIIELSDNNKIETTAYQMLLLISNILDNYKFEDSNMNISARNVSLHEILNESAELVLPISNQKELHILNQTKNHLIRVDKQIFVRLFVNLLSNAVKFSSFGKEIFIKSEQKNNILKVSIINQSENFTKELNPNIFSKYHQETKKQFGVSYSSGIGLAFCKIAVEAHGGKISAKTLPNNKVEFSFEVPVLQQEILQQEIKQFSPEKTLNLTNNDTEIATELIDQLENIKIYEASKFERTIENTIKIDTISADFKNWLAGLSEKYYDMNEEHYKQQLAELANLVNK